MRRSAAPASDGLDCSNHRDMGYGHGIWDMGDMAMDWHGGGKIIKPERGIIWGMREGDRHVVSTLGL